MSQVLQEGMVHCVHKLKTSSESQKTKGCLSVMSVHIDMPHIAVLVGPVWNLDWSHSPLNT